jgi:hypothetical protein
MESLVPAHSLLYRVGYALKFKALSPEIARPSLLARIGFGNKGCLQISFRGVAHGQERV